MTREGSANAYSVALGSDAHVAHGQSSGGGERLRIARFIDVVAAGAGQ